MSEQKIHLKISENDSDVAYLTLPGHPGAGEANVVAKQIDLRSLIPGYQGPDIFLDFSHGDKLIGIEILA